MVNLSTTIIAEASNNHNGDMSLAKKMIDKAKLAGCDIIKFQTYVTEQLVGIKDNEVLDHLLKAELGIEEHLQLIAYCDEIGIEFMSSPFDLQSIELLSQLGLDKIKVPSGQITNEEYLRAIATLNMEKIISTGMCNNEDIQRALDIIGTVDVTLLHCTSSYPTPYEDVNLRAMLGMAEFGVPIGLSDHTLGIEIPLAATALGATAIEKHFTLNRKLKGPDHFMSTTPGELKKMVAGIRHIEQALGSWDKSPAPSELKTLSRRS